MKDKKDLPDYETSVILMTNEQMAAEYLKARTKHFNDIELEKAAAEKDKAEKEHITAVKAEIQKYFK